MQRSEWVGRRRARDGDYRMLGDVEELCKLRRIKLDIVVKGMDTFRHTLVAWFGDAPDGMSRSNLAKVMGFLSIQARWAPDGKSPAMGRPLPHSGRRRPESVMPGDHFRVSPPRALVGSISPCLPGWTMGPCESDVRLAGSSRWMPRLPGRCLAAPGRAESH
jgi:hypothetical protein